MRMRVPVPLRADAYTISGECLASEKARERSVYNFTNRISPHNAFPELCRDSRMVFYGLSDFINSCLTDKCTHEDVDESIRFMESAYSFGGKLPFDPIIWHKVVTDYDGYYPLKIEAIPEGSTFFPNEPIIQVTSLAKGFGELAAHIEANMLGMVACATAKATLSRHWLQRMREWLSDEFDNDEAILAASQFMIHDFGMRASSTPEEAEILGRAHLLSFHGTDTFSSAYQAWKMGAKRPTGTSVLALAHRIVQGYELESESFFNLHEETQQCGDKGTPKIGSYVADCYNFEDAIRQLSALSNNDPLVVVRPDSGDYIENTRTYLKHSEGNSLRFLHGDSMNPTKTDKVLDIIKKAKRKISDSGIFGVGGWLRNNATRDTFSSAYKLCAIGKDNEPVCKLSDTPAKMSIPGITIIRRGLEADDSSSVRLVEESGDETDTQVYYNGGKFKNISKPNFGCLQRRTVEDFDRWASVAAKSPGLGLDRTLLSEGIKELQDETMDRHKACGLSFAHYCPKTEGYEQGRNGNLCGRVWPNI